MQRPDIETVLRRLSEVAQKFQRVFLVHILLFCGAHLVPTYSLILPMWAWAAAPPPSRILFAVLRLLDTVTWQRVGNETVYSVFGHLLRPREATAMSVPFCSYMYTQRIVLF